MQQATDTRSATSSAWTNCSEHPLEVSSSWPSHRRLKINYKPVSVTSAPPTKSHVDEHLQMLSPSKTKTYVVFFLFMGFSSINHPCWGIQLMKLTINFHGKNMFFSIETRCVCDSWGRSRIPPERTFPRCPATG